MSQAPLIGERPPEVIARPKCPQCAKPLRPWFKTNWETRREADGTSVITRPVSREWTGEYQGHGAFCSTKCCIKFANAAFLAGYRLVSKERS